MNIFKSFKTDFAFLDSGTGGLPYMLHLKEAFPNSKCAYLADTCNFPYGTKSRDEIIKNATLAVEKIIDKFSPQIIVIACNTISVSALEELRDKFSIPFVGTVPAIKLAANVSENKRIGLLATEQTVSNFYTDGLIKDFASDCFVMKKGDNKLVEFVEHEFFHCDMEKSLSVVQEAVDCFSVQNIDTIILGCTHFIHLSELFEKVVGNKIKIVDSRDGVVKQALKLYHPTELKKSCILDMEFFTSGNISKNQEKEYIHLARKLNIPWGGNI